MRPLWLAAVAAVAVACVIPQPADPATTSGGAPGAGGEVTCAQACARIVECGFLDDAAECEAECQRQGYDAATRAEVANGSCAEIAAMAQAELDAQE